MWIGESEVCLFSLANSHGRTLQVKALGRVISTKDPGLTVKNADMEFTPAPMAPLMTDFGLATRRMGMVALFITVTAIHFSATFHGVKETRMMENLSTTFGMVHVSTRGSMAKNNASYGKMEFAMSGQRKTLKC
jgi:hypothetical protein